MNHVTGKWEDAKEEINFLTPKSAFKWEIRIGSFSKKEHFIYNSNSTFMVLLTKIGLKGDTLEKNITCHMKKHFVINETKYKGN